MLVIKNYKKIKNQYFGDWQIGRVEELPECYALQAFNANTKKSITMDIVRERMMDESEYDIPYKISLVEDNRGGNVIEDIIYHSVLEDMELFGESLVHYLNTL
jgi:GTPase Era involved in 16S rRNA processing